ncbi:MAG TPA: NAD(P)(+) transhydrogenase (Re/Si-specific) subunit beta [Alphaproteobacteria bacterium]|nr:NAD(P)(+) transhydrogenase (Re/Si-specific) subunit beta [Alphaproteobacteria bacterium]
MHPSYILEATYLIASCLFVMGLKGLSHPDTARRGMIMAAAGMTAALVGTLFHPDIHNYIYIGIGLIVGSAIGIPMAMVPMTAMPQRTALSHAFGALAASMVGIAEYVIHGSTLGNVKMGALGLEVMLGSLTVTGSLIAAGKLQEVIRGTPLIFKGQHFVNLGLFLAMITCFVLWVMHPGAANAQIYFFTLVGLSFVFGVMLVIPIGAADMPVVMSLLNSYAGLSSAATGFVLSNNVLIIAGTLDGFSGFILSILMCRAMNRSITNVLFGGFGATVTAETGVSGTMREVSVDDVAVQLAYANQVVFVPGYGMATAQAQHACRELGNLLEERGVAVKYAIHPVAGRMPGHMNVLLAEANVPYSSLYEMEQINPEMPATDVAVVIGANDVVNPDARDNPKSLIAGMPIIEVDRAKSVVVLKRGKGKGFSGLENPLFFKPVTGMLYGDAKSSLTNLAQAVQKV